MFAIKHGSGFYYTSTNKGEDVLKCFTSVDINDATKFKSYDKAEKEIDNVLNPTLTVLSIVKVEDVDGD